MVSSLIASRWLCRWEASAGRRVAVVALVAVGHVLFVGWILSGRLPLAGEAALVLGNLLVVAYAAFRARRSDLTAARAIAWVVGVTTLQALVPAAVIEVLSPRSSMPMSDVVAGAVVVVTWGLLGGLAASTVAAPLALAIDRWRTEPGPRRGLDLAATFACMGTSLVLVRPTHLARLTSSCHGAWTIASCFTPVTLRAVGAAALVACSLGLALAALACEFVARRRNADARRGRSGELRLVAIDGLDTAGAPSLALTGARPRWALVRTRSAGSYRAGSPVDVVALLPDPEALSWRVYALPIVTLACALSLLAPRAP